jgi:hypothetical protein
MSFRWPHLWRSSSLLERLAAVEKQQALLSSRQRSIQQSAVESLKLLAAAAAEKSAQSKGQPLPAFANLLEAECYKILAILAETSDELRAHSDHESTPENPEFQKLQNALSEVRELLRELLQRTESIEYLAQYYEHRIDTIYQRLIPLVSVDAAPAELRCAQGDS